MWCRLSRLSSRAPLICHSERSEEPPKSRWAPGGIPRRVAPRNDTRGGAPRHDEGGSVRRVATGRSAGPAGIATVPAALRVNVGLRSTRAFVVTPDGLLAALRPFDDGVADALRDQLDAADRVVVARDDVVDDVRIAVRVGDGDDRDAGLVGFLHRDRLHGRVDDEHRRRERPHGLETTEVLLEARALLLEARDFLL